MAKYYRGKQIGNGKFVYGVYEDSIPAISFDLKFWHMVIPESVEEVDFDSFCDFRNKHFGRIEVD